MTRREISLNCCSPHIYRENKFESTLTMIYIAVYSSEPQPNSPKAGILAVSLVSLKAENFDLLHLFSLILTDLLSCD